MIFLRATSKLPSSRLKLQHHPEWKPGSQSEINRRQSAQNRSVPKDGLISFEEMRNQFVEEEHHPRWRNLRPAPIRHNRLFTRFELNTVLLLRYGRSQPPFTNHVKQPTYIARLLRRQPTVIWRILRKFEYSDHDLDDFYSDGRIRSGRRIENLTKEVENWVVNQNTLTDQKLLSLPKRLEILKQRFNVEMSD